MKPVSPIPLYVLAFVTAVSAPISLSAADDGTDSNNANATASDQPGRGGRGRGAGRGGARGGFGVGQVDRLDAALSLTDEQKTQITAIYEKAREEAQAARGDPAGGTPEAMAEIMAKVRADVRAVLTSEQQEKFDALPEGRGSGRGGRGGPPADAQGRGGRGRGPGPGGAGPRGGGRGARGGGE